MLLVFQVWVFHYESCNVLALFTYHNRFCKKLVELFYNDDTVDGGSVPHVVVDNTRNCVVNNFADYDMVFFTELICIWNYYILEIGDT